MFDIVLVVAAGLATLLAATWYYQSFKQPTTPTPREPSKALKVLQPSCRTCEHWDHDYGQQLMQKHRPFANASEHISPAQMGVPVRAFRDNPRYLEVRAELDKALDDNAPDAKVRELQAELANLNPQVIDEDELDVDPNLERLQWAAFGCCMHHREIRADIDVCDTYTERGVS